MPKLFDLVDGQLEHHTQVDTTQPLVGLRRDIIAGKTALAPTTLPLFDGPIALDFETHGLPQWKCIKQAGLDPHLSTIRTIQVSDGMRCWIVDTRHTPNWKEWLVELINRAEYVIAHNAKFEAKNVHVHCGRQPNVKWRCTYVASILVEYAQRHSLESVTQRWTGYEMDKNEQLSDWSVPVLSRSQVLYALRDVAYMHEVHDKLLGELAIRGMRKLFLEVESPLILPLAEIEVTGLPVNAQYVAQALAKLEPEVAEKAKAAQQAIFDVYNQYGDASRLTDILWKTADVPKGSHVALPGQLDSPEKIGLSRNKDLLQYFYAIVGPNGPLLEGNSVDKTALFDCISRADFEVNGETVNLVWILLKYRDRYKRLEFLRKLSVPWSPNLPVGQACLHPVTGRIHTEIKYAVTGRMLASSGSGREDAEEDLMGGSKVNKEQPWLTNIQQFPRDYEIRACFGFDQYESTSEDSHCIPEMDVDGEVTAWKDGTAKDGSALPWKGGKHHKHPGEWAIISADYSALEAFILAHLSRDPGMLSAVKSEDFHRTNASRIYKVAYEAVEKWMRQVAKNVGYCTAYGGAAPKIAQTANMAFIQNQLDVRITVADAAAAQAAYFAAYPMVEPYLERQFAHVERFGWTRPTKLGRTRNIAAEVEYDRQVRGKNSNARTKAYNDPMQATNVDIIKTALLAIYRHVVDNYAEGEVEIGPPIHDEQLMFGQRQFLPDLGAAMAHHMKAAMDYVLSDAAGTPTFNVPVVPSYGPSWGHAH